MDIFFMIGTDILGQRQERAIPRVGDFIVVGNFKLVVKEVVWHFDNFTTWVEIQV